MIFTLFFTSVYIQKQLKLQTIYVLKKEMLPKIPHFLSKSGFQCVGYVKKHTNIVNTRDFTAVICILFQNSFWSFTFQMFFLYQPSATNSPKFSRNRKCMTIFMILHKIFQPKACSLQLCVYTYFLLFFLR